MPKRNRGILGQTALALATLFAVISGGTLWYWADAQEARYRDAADRNARYESNAARERVQLECPITATPSVECQVRVEYESDEAQARTRELEAQQTVAVWTKAMGLAAVIGMSVGVLGLGLIFFTFRETRRAANAGLEANEIARESNERQLRAYVGPEDEQVSDFRVGGDGKFHCKVFNRGQTPAYNVRICSIVIFSQEDPDKVRVRFKQPTPLSNTTIGPGNYLTHNSVSDSGLSEIAVYGISNGDITAVFAGVISYDDIFGKRHRTTFKTWLKGRGKLLPEQNDMSAALKGNRAN